MFVIKHKPSGLYFKRGNMTSKWDSKLVEKSQATLYRTKAGAIKSAGSYEPFTGEQLKRDKYGLIKQFGTYVLDESKWEIVPAEIV